MGNLRKDKAGGECLQFLDDGDMVFPGTEGNGPADLLEVDPCEVIEGPEVGRIVVLPQETFLCQRLIFKTGADEYVAHARADIGDDQVFILAFLVPALYHFVLLVPFLGRDTQPYRDPYFLTVDIKFHIQGEPVGLAFFALSNNSYCRHFICLFYACGGYMPTNMPTQAGY